MLLILFFACLALYYAPLTLRLCYQSGTGEALLLPCAGARRGLRLWHGVLWPPAPQKREKGAHRFAARPAAANLRRLLQRLLRQTSVRQLDCDIRIGLRDPFAASMTAGVCLAALGSLRAMAAHSLRRFPAAPHIHVRCAGPPGLVSGSLQCIFQIRLGDIIVDMILLLWMMIKGRRNNVKRA